MKKFFTEEKVDEIFDIMFDLAMGLGPILMIRTLRSEHLMLVITLITV